MKKLTAITTLIVSTMAIASCSTETAEASDAEESSTYPGLSAKEARAVDNCGEEILSMVSSPDNSISITDPVVEFADEGSNFELYRVDAIAEYTVPDGTHLTDMDFKCGASFNADFGESAKIFMINGFMFD